MLDWAELNKSECQKCEESMYHVKFYGFQRLHPGIDREHWRWGRKDTGKSNTIRPSAFERRWFCMIVAPESKLNEMTARMEE